MNNKKLQFIRAVRLLAPHERLILQFAKKVRAEGLPIRPGGVALEFVAAMQRRRPGPVCPRRLPPLRSGHFAE